MKKKRTALAVLTMRVVLLLYDLFLVSLSVVLVFLYFLKTNRLLVCCFNNVILLYCLGEAKSFKINGLVRFMCDKKLLNYDKILLSGDKKLLGW